MPAGGVFARVSPAVSGYPSEAASRGDVMGERHVVRDHQEGNWKVVCPSSGSTGSRTPIQADAIDFACADLREAGGGQVLIHGADGSVRDKRTVSLQDSA